MVSSLFLLFLKLRDLAAGVRLQLDLLGGPSVFGLLNDVLTFLAHLHCELLRLGWPEVFEGLEPVLHDGLENTLAAHNTPLLAADVDELLVGVLAAHKWQILLEQFLRGVDKYLVAFLELELLLADEATDFPGVGLIVLCGQVAAREHLMFAWELERRRQWVG